MIFHLLALPVIVIAVVLTTVFWFWMLLDCFFNRSLRGAKNVLWFLWILCTHLLGAIAYFIMGRSQKQVAMV